MPIRTLIPRIAAGSIAALALTAACQDAGAPTDVAASAARGDAPGVHRQYGAPVSLGNGRARSYVVIDQKRGGTIELGVALDETAMQGLRAPDPAHGEHGDHDMYLLPLPARNGTAFELVELDWNPKGHGAPYAAPHFDFHFYTIGRAERDAILPTDPAWAAKAAHEPPAADIPPFYVNPANILGLPPEAIAVPQMGMHWIDSRAPELRPPGAPGAAPFTTTFIYGAWDGKLIFMEPMITREYIMAKRDATDPAVRNEVIAIPTSAAHPGGAFKPNAYRIQYDAQAKEYRIGMTVVAGQ